ncbi:hypothetical protein CARUB_v10027971mg [Capsella rubella]|uniref:Uncharacterized protein n=1 Tax=Capsella rubella TaxID=81985 RepID=R0F0B2_9BRAS|nr:hypothetical protein CARUB_v10027971mg [Capsella rubella]
MAFLFNNASISSHLRSTSSQKTGDALLLSRRGLHIEPGTREKAVSYSIQSGCCYEIFVKAAMRKEAMAAGKSS